MRENCYNYNLNRGQSNLLKFELYQVSTVDETSNPTDIILLSRDEFEKKGMIIELEIFENCELDKILSCILNFNVSFQEQINFPKLRLYQLSTIEYPSVLPETYITIDMIQEQVDIDFRAHINCTKNKYYFLLTADNLTTPAIVYLPSNMQITQEIKMAAPKYTKGEALSLEEVSIVIDMYTGRYYAAQALMILPGSELSSSISLIYNNYKNDDDYLTNSNYFKLPHSFKFDLQQVVKKHKVQDEYLYEDATGYRHYFKKIATNTYIEKYGKGLMLTKNSSSFKIEDRTGKILTFNSDGYLVKIQFDKDFLNIIYNQLENGEQAIRYIEDSCGRKIEILYQDKSIYITRDERFSIDINYTNNYLNVYYNANSKMYIYTFNENDLPLKIEYSRNDGLDYSKKQFLYLYQTLTEITKIEYYFENKLQNLKTFEYISLTTRTKTYQKNEDLEPIIVEYSFDESGNYLKHYECVKVGDTEKHYGEQKRNEDIYKYELKEEIMLVNNVFIDDDNKWEEDTGMDLVTRVFSKTFYATFIKENKYNIHMYMIPNVEFDNPIYSEKYNICMKIEGIGENDETVSIFGYDEIFNLKNNTNYVCGYTEEDNYVILYIKKELELNQNIKGLKISFKIEENHGFTINSLYTDTNMKEIPKYFIDEKIPNTVVCDSMFFPKGLYSNSFRKAMGYGLKKPDDIVYTDLNGETHSLGSQDINLSDYLENLKNFENGINVFWYNMLQDAVTNVNLISVKLVYDTTAVNLINISISELYSYSGRNIYSFITYTWLTYLQATIERDYKNNNYISVNTTRFDRYGRITEKTKGYYNISNPNMEYYEYNDYQNLVETYQYEKSEDSSTSKYGNCIKKEIYSEGDREKGEERLYYSTNEYIYDDTYQNFITTEIVTINEPYQEENSVKTYQTTYDLEYGALILFTDPSRKKQIYTYSDAFQRLTSIEESIYNANQITNEDDPTDISTYKFELSNRIIYDGDYLIKMSHENKMNYYYDYSDFDQNIEFSIGYLPVDDTQGSEEGVKQLIEGSRKIEDDQLVLMEIRENDTVYETYFSNGDSIYYVYDKYNRLIKEMQLIDNTYQTMVLYIYGEKELNENTILGDTVYNINSYSDTRLIVSGSSLLRSVYDYYENTKIEYYYDENKVLVEKIKKTLDLSPTILYSYENKYQDGVLISKTITGKINQTIEYKKGPLSQLQAEIIKTETSQNFIVYNSYDQLGRLKQIGYSNSNEKIDENIPKYERGSYTEQIIYLDYDKVEYSDRAGVYPKTYAMPYSNTIYDLVFDDNGKIIQIKDNNDNELKSYEYSLDGSLIREDNRYLNKTIIYKYSKEEDYRVVTGSNIYKKIVCGYKDLNDIQSITEYIYDTNYSDLLVKIKKDEIFEHTILYDNSLNTTVCNNRQYIYEKGHNLFKVKEGENTIIECFYNKDNVRYKKVLNSTNNESIEYILDGTIILKEIKGYDEGFIRKIVYEITYIYANNRLQGFDYKDENGTTRYYYEYDIEQNIVGIYKLLENDDVILAASYIYDAFGNHTIENFDTTTDIQVGNINPFRYKGYYYDVETQLFYCNSRYYSPELCRWISPDSVEYLDPESINGLNLYCYCYNNPISYSDPSGNLPQWAEWLIGGAVIVGLGIATVFTGGAAGVILGAAFYGAVTSAVGGALVGGIIGGITGGWEGALDGAASGFMWGAISGAVTGALTSGINIATGSVQIVGSAQKTGSLFHQFASNVQAGKMSLAVGRYSEIHLNRSKGLGIKGFRPDVTGVTKNGLRVVEVVSSSQTYASQVAKVGRMMGQYSHISNGLTLDALRFITSWFVF